MRVIGRAKKESLVLGAETFEIGVGVGLALLPVRLLMLRRTTKIREGIVKSATTSSISGFLSYKRSIVLLRIRVFFRVLLNSIFSIAILLYKEKD